MSFLDDLHWKVSSSEDAEAKYDFDTIKSECAVKEAALKNLDIVFPLSNELLIDIDNEESFAKYQKNIPKFQMHVATVLEEYITPSKSGNPCKKHIRLFLDRNIEPGERLMYQSFLGSDPTRELLSYVRLINGDPNPTLFYEKKRNLLVAAPEPLQLTEGLPLDQV